MPNSSGTFLGANEDSTRTLVEIEKKIARATVLQKSWGGTT
jgi:prolyl 4-hydroxylase